MKCETVGDLIMKCETDGCQQEAEFYDPMDNRLCSDCIQRNVETGEYSWDDCVAIPEIAS